MRTAIKERAFQPGTSQSATGLLFAVLQHLY